MRKILGAAFLSGILILGRAWASDALQTFDVASDPVFGKASIVLRDYAERKRPHKKNSFCVLGLIDDANGKLAYVFWPERNKLFLWGGEDLKEFEPSKIWDLKKDVVAKETPASRTSTYLFVQSEVDRLHEACEKSGLKLSFSK